jgi:diacylglycerol kinase
MHCLAITDDNHTAYYSRNNGSNRKNIILFPAITAPHYSTIYTTIMSKPQPLFKAFYHAFKGMQYFFFNDRNGKIHLTSTIAVIIISFVMGLSATEWALILLCIAVVMALEMMNAALEKLCDLVHKEYHPFIKITKDVSAAAVLWAAIISVVIASIIFIPKIILLL